MPSNGKQRYLTLTFGCIAALSAGTNYVFGAYAPQLATRLSLTSTQTNAVGAAGNLGVYLSGPFVGRSVDKRGPRATLLFAACALGIGYTGVRAFYDGGEAGLLSQFGLPSLALAEALTGIGSAAGISSSANSVAKSFAHKQRGSRMSIIMGAFGLSSFLYSTLSHLLTGEDRISSFLLLLSLGSSISMLLGAIFIRPALLDHSPIFAVFRPPPDERSPLVVNSDDEDEAEEELAREAEVRKQHEEGLDLSGWALVKTVDFQVYFTIIMLCAGCGLMYINNLGNLVVTLVPRDKDPRDVAKLQASLVSLLSVLNCIGRLLSGFAGDYIVHHAPARFRIARVWLLVPMAGFFVISQLLVLGTTQAEGWNGLALPTAVTGLSYGILFGLSAVLVLEWFGIRSFSGNNGLVSLGPAIGGNFCNLLFGRIYDHHVPTSRPSPFAPLALTADGMLSRPVSSLASSRICVEGPTCFAAAFKITTAMSLCALALAILLGIRKGRKRGIVLSN